uniref:Transmembrane protein 120A n=1 Tax=Ursus maritimus TaxID=29073 RepID=A0A384CPU0_URSMA
MKQSFWELVCFWDRGAVRASGLAGGAPSPGQPGGEGNLRESPRLAASFSCSDPPKEPRGESVPPPSAQQAPAHSGLLPDPQETHRLYRVKLEELTKLQNSCTSSIARQKKQLQELALVLKKCKPSLQWGAKEAAQELENQIKERQGLFFDMEAYLPKKNGLYLSLVLGNVNVTLLSKQAKIKGWWVFHHYVSTFLSGVMLTWPDGLMYQKFRNQFLSFSMYQSFVQFLQYYYQSGCLYRLRALGERHTMDLTVEGFQSWMWRGLTFLLPFLFFGHFWQLFNALTLFNLARDPECKEWQVLMCGFPFLLLFLGNFFTTLRVVHQKFHSQRRGSKKE